MGKRTPDWPAYPSWSTARFFGFLRSALRAAFNKYPPKYECLNRAKQPYKGEDKRRKFVYICNECGGEFKNTQVQVDHITPAGSLKAFKDLPGFCERLFCGVDGLQLLCKSCHTKKTKEERRKSS
jgi:5-methylcytosine-specific restriction endonuclease McrA